jgi:hypothetical protein
MDTEDPLVRRRPTLNPYFRGGAQILKQLMWDLHLEAWRSRHRLRQLRERYAGQKAVVLCNGPSLLKVDFERLQGSGCFTFGLNKINLLFDKTSLRPSCVVAVNPLVIEQNSEFYNKTDFPLFLDSCAVANRLVRSRKNVIFLHSAGVQGFARDCSMSIDQGHTVTYVALQLAFHMGFTRVAIVGADHNFAVTGPANKTVVAGEKDESHFDPNYFAGGVKWQLPDLFESEVAYGRARQVYAAHDRTIYNCTDGGKLECFERMTLEQFLIKT